MNIHSVAGMAARDHWFVLGLLMCRWIQSHKGSLFIGIACLFVLMTWMSMNMTDVIVDTSYLENSHHNSYITSNRFVTTEKAPSKLDIEHRKRVEVFSRILQKQMKRQRREGDQTQCIHPKLDLKYDTNKFAFSVLPPLNCTGNGFFFLHKGVLVLNLSRVQEPELFGKCSFYQIDRYNDDIHSYKKPVVVKSPPFKATVDGDFVHIQCMLKSTLENERPERFSEERKDEINYEADNENQYEKNVAKKGMKEEPVDNKADVPHENRSLDKKDKNENNDLPADYDDKDYDTFNENYGNWPIFSSFVSPEYESDLEQFLVQIHPKPEVFERIAEIKAASDKHHPMKLNILMFALDSMSHLSYKRKLPKTYKYLKDELGAAILENYNIVGDATTAAIIPMLTGKTEADLPDVRSSRYQYETEYLDQYPLVWEDFKKQGYVTLYAEDEPSLATFNLRLNGFNKPPTDHYMRPFWQAVWESGLQKNSEQFCNGDIAHHHFMLHYLEDFFIKYHSVPKFAFGFHGELTHADNNPAQYIDEELFNLLQRLKQEKFLEDTVLIVFGDHGARYSKVRRTVQGKLEERLPLMSFVFPQQFRQQYPRLYKNLQTNTQRLTTPFDIHETLLDILNLTEANDPKSRSRIVPGISLMKEIPADRTCADAGIDMHWCSCLHQINVDPTEEVVKPVVLELLDYLNAQILNHRDQCAKLSLKRVLNVQIVMPNQQVLKFMRSIDSDQRVANFSHDIDPDVVHYQLQVETLPCEAIYEATVMADLRNLSNYRYSVTPGISRINMYGSQPKCVQGTYPLLRKFCCCHDYLAKLKES